MTSLKATSWRSSKKNLLFYLVYLLTLGVIFAAAGEVAVRYKGVKPWVKEKILVYVTPGGKFYQQHATLGYSNIPGSFHVALEKGFSFNVTQLPNTLRVTHPVDTYSDPKKKPEIWILGCSMTYGWSLNDSETYPWLLQERLPDYEVVNFGVNGYGTIHSLIQFREALKTRTPKVAILVYTTLHDQRNTFSRIRRKRVAPYNVLGPLVQPYALLENGKLRYFLADVEYREFPFMRYSALAHFIEMMYDRLELRKYHSHSVSEALVAEMAEVAKQHGVKFIVANILGGQSMLEWARERGISTVDIAVDLALKENTNLPHDEHPSALAARQYADTLETFLKTGIPQ